MTIVEGKIIDYEQAKSVGQNQNWAQNITIEDQQGRTLQGEILVKEKNIIRVNTTEYVKWEVSQSDYGPKFKRHRETTWQGGGGQRGGGGGGKKDVDWDKIAQGKVLCNMISAAITAGEIKCPDIRTAKYLTSVVMGTEPQPQGGDPNPDYVGDDPAQTEENDEIPF